jgi:branched-chain amino acid transport system permease protein
VAAALLWVAAVVLAVQWAYAAQFGVDDGAGFNVAGVPLPVAVSPLWLGVVVSVLAGLGALAAHYAIRARARVEVRLDSTETVGDSR